MKKLFFIIPTMLICLVIINLSAEAKQKQDKDFNSIIAVNHLDYEEVCNAVKEAGGTVRFQYKYCEAVAVTMPSDNLESILNMPEVQGFYKDREFSLPKPPLINRPGFETVYDHIQNTADHVQTTTAELEGLIGSGPNNYQPFTNDLTGASDFWSNTGHYGEEVIVGIMDTGVSSAAMAVAPRIVGAENFTGDGIPGDSPLNHPHGTEVACCVGADAIFGFDDPKIQNAVKAYCPSCVISNYFDPGIDGILMVGQAPEASFYSFKVFDTNLTTSVSILLAAMERAIELKKENIIPNLKVINMSFGGPSLFSGEDPFFAQLVEMMDDVGILVTVSAGNAGPGGMTISDPGLAENILTVGASNDATHERIVMEIFFPPYYSGGGLLWRPIDNNQTAYFSSRGPTADGRTDPEIVAPGTWQFVQHANGHSISWASGTSFSAATVAGAAALLLSAHPESQPKDLRGALLNGANPTLLTDNSGEQDQGFGFLDVFAANTELIEGAKNPKDKGEDKKKVKQNIKKVADINVIKKKDFTENTSDLLPGQRKEFFYEIKTNVKQVTVTISDVIPELQPDAQNPLFGDNLFVFIHSAKTSAIGADGDYRAGTPAFVGGDATFVLEGSDLDEGIARITILGDWINAGKISATIHISREDEKQDHYFSKKGDVAEGELKIIYIDVPLSAEELNLELNWKKDWGHYPTNDLDMKVYDSDDNLIRLDNDGDGDFDGFSLDSPERINIDNPAAGTWTVLIYGFKVWEKEEKFELFVKGVSKTKVSKK